MPDRRHILDAIGNTPLVELRNIVPKGIQTGIGRPPGRWLSLPAPGIAQPSLFACRKSRREIKRLYDLVIGDSGVIIEFLDIRFGACFEETHAPSVIGGEC